MAKDTIPQLRPRPRIPGVAMQVDAAFTPAREAIETFLTRQDVAGHLDLAAVYLYLAYVEADILGRWSDPCQAAWRIAAAEVLHASALGLKDRTLLRWIGRKDLDTLLWQYAKAGALMHEAVRHGIRPGRDLAQAVRPFTDAWAQRERVRMVVPPQYRRIAERSEAGAPPKAFRGPLKDKLTIAPAAFYPLLKDGLKLCGSELTLDRLADFMQVDRKLLRRYLDHPDYGPRWEDLKALGSLAACEASGWKCPC